MVSAIQLLFNIFNSYLLKKLVLALMNLFDTRYSLELLLIHIYQANTHRESKFNLAITEYPSTIVFLKHHTMKNKAYNNRR